MSNMSQDAVTTNDKNPVYTWTRNSVTTSVKYQHVNSYSLIDALVQSGLTHDKTLIANARSKNNRGYQKHILTFDTGYTIGDDRLKLLVTNSHDGRSSLKFNLGIFRMICSNGLIVGDSVYLSRLRHVGNIIEHVPAEIDRIRTILPLVAEKVALMKNTILSPEQVHEFAEKAAVNRLKSIKDAHIGDLYTITKVRRNGDENHDLWTVFNRVQEGIVRGGLEYYRGNQRMHCRAIKGLNSSVDVNKFLWDTAETYLKTA